MPIFGAMTAATATPPTGFLERRFRLTERRTSVRTEALGGLATFLTMSYILFVNPAILSAAHMPFTAVAVATALASCVATLAMGLFTNLPFALAPGLGINAVVAFDIVLGRGLEWPVAMSIIVIEGLIALVLVLAGLRGAIMRAVPLELKLSIGVGIGLFITLVGLREGGIVVNDPATGIGLGDLTSGPALIALGGIAVAAVLVARRVPGAVILGVISAYLLGLIFGVLEGPDGVVDVPGSGDFSTIGDGLDPDNLKDALTVSLIPVIFALFMTDFFDTIGTAVAVGRSGGVGDQPRLLPDTPRPLPGGSGGGALGGAAGTSSGTTCVGRGVGGGGARRRVGHVERDDVRGERRRRGGGRAHGPELDRRRGAVRAGDLLRAADRRRRAGGAARGRRHRQPRDRARPGHGRLPDDPPGRGHRLAGAGVRAARVSHHRRHPADVLDRCGDRARDLRLRTGHGRAQPGGR